jgi:hypothetical protein
MPLEVLTMRPLKNCSLFVETPRVSHIQDPNLKLQVLLLMIVLCLSMLSQVPLHVAAPGIFHVVLAKRIWKYCPRFVETPRVSHTLYPDLKFQVLAKRLLKNCPLFVQVLLVSHIQNQNWKFQELLLMVALCLPKLLHVPLHVTGPLIFLVVWSKRLWKNCPRFVETSRVSHIPNPCLKFQVPLLMVARGLS